MNICITGSFGNRDVGDDAMLTCWLEHLRQLGIGREAIWLVGHQPEYMAWYFSHPLEQCISSKTFPGDFPVSSMDMLLVTGGGTMHTRGAGGGSIRRANQLIGPFLRAGVPTFISGQTVGPLGVDASHDAIARDIIGGADVFTVRDSTYSPGFISDIAAHPQELICTVDDAAALSYSGSRLPTRLEAFLADTRRPIVAFNLDTFTWRTPECVRRVGQALLHLLRLNWRAVLVPHHPNDSLAYKRYLWPLIPNDLRGQIREFYQPSYRAEQCKRIISQCQLAIGGRYHFVVFAASCGVPVVGMAPCEYAYVKQHGCLRELGLGDCVVGPEKVFDPEALIAAVGRVVAVRPSGVMPYSDSFAAFSKWYAGK